MCAASLQNTKDVHRENLPNVYASCNATTVYRNNTLSCRFYVASSDKAKKVIRGMLCMQHIGLGELFSTVASRLADKSTLNQHKFKSKNVIRANVSDQIRKIIICYKSIAYNINVMRQSACLMVNNFASIFNCPLVGRASDSTMDAP